jgi:hypothetical protein
MSTPAISIVLNVALFGRPRRGPVIASTSSIVNSPDSTSSIERSAPKMPSRFAMNPGVSLASTMPLPSRRSAKSETRSTTAAAVAVVGITSSNLRYLGGLKKCVPSHLDASADGSPEAIAAIGMPEVLVERNSLREKCASQAREQRLFDLK